MPIRIARQAGETATEKSKAKPQPPLKDKPKPEGNS